MLRKTLCLFLSATITLMPICVNADENNDCGADILLQLYEERDNECFLDENMTNKESEAILKYKETMSSLEKEYPDFYGGSYIDGDGKYVVLTSDEEKCKAYNIKADRYVKCDYSYSELENTYEFLNDITKDMEENGNYNILNKISEYYIAEESNRIVVGVKRDNVESVKDFLDANIEDSEIYEIEEVGDIEDDTTYLRLGRKMFISHGDGTGSYVSIGIKASFVSSSGNDIYGFITAGHGSNGTGEFVYISNNVSNAAVGKVVKRKYSDSVDAAFVRITNSNYEASRKLMYSNASGSTNNTITINANNYVWLLDEAVGTTVYKCGYSTYLTSGTIVANSATTIVGNKTFTDLYKCTYASASGDSGGVVYFNDPDDGYSYIGIHKSSSTIGNYSYCVKWENIDDYWDIWFE